MNDTLSKIEKRTAYTLLLPAVFLVFAIVLFPIFANIWISFKEVQLKDIRIPEPRAKKIVKSIPEDKTKLKIVYRLRNSYWYTRQESLILSGFQLKAICNVIIRGESLSVVHPCPSVS